MKIWAQIFWWLVALLMLAAPWILILSSGHAQAASAPAGAPASTDLSEPENLANPRTGEAGTWIPRWVEREHILDEHRLKMCLKDVELADQDILASSDRATALEKALAETTRAKDESQTETYALTHELALADEKVERRGKALWVVVSVSLSLITGAAGAVLLR